MTVESGHRQRSCIPPGPPIGTRPDMELDSKNRHIHSIPVHTHCRHNPRYWVRLCKCFHIHRSCWRRWLDPHIHPHTGSLDPYMDCSASPSPIRFPSPWIRLAKSLPRWWTNPSPRRSRSRSHQREHRLRRRRSGLPNTVHRCRRTPALQRCTGFHHPRHRALHIARALQSQAPTQFRDRTVCMPYSC
jgi:hypothetical protein